MNPEQLALLRGIKTSLLHLMATGPLETLQPVTDAYLAVRRAEGAMPKLGTNLPTGKPGDLDELRRERNHPMHAVALEMADKAIASAGPHGFDQGNHPLDAAGVCVDPRWQRAFAVGTKQPVGFEPFEAAP